MMPDLTPTIISYRFGKRWAWPHIVQYQITEGEHAGNVLDVPPDRHAYPAPRRTDPHTGRDTTPVGSAAYRFLIHDLDAFDALTASRAIYSKAHTGCGYKLSDNRKTA